MRYETGTDQSLPWLTWQSKAGTVPLRGLAALLLGSMVYALVSGNWGIGAISFGAAAPGLDRLRGTRSRPGGAIGWVLVLCGAFVVVDALI